VIPEHDFLPNIGFKPTILTPSTKLQIDKKSLFKLLIKGRGERIGRTSLYTSRNSFLLPDLATLLLLHKDCIQKPSSIPDGKKDVSLLNAGLFKRCMGDDIFDKKRANNMLRNLKSFCTA
jgi:hypothetical protein